MWDAISELSARKWLRALSSVSTPGFWKYSSVVGITAAATLRQVQKHTSAKVVKRLCRKIKVRKRTLE